jgi:hypothetical protein
MGWKKFTETEKGVAGQVERESHVDSFFLTLRVLCIMNSLRLGQTVNRWYYLKVLEHLRENVRRKLPQLWRNNSWLLHHDDVSAHASLNT